MAQDLIPAAVKNVLDLKQQLFFHDPLILPKAWIPGQ
jgi:hypothetical protein